MRLDDPAAWAWMPAEVDPFIDHRPDDPTCPVATYGPESGGFEVQTGACHYGAFEQPLIVEVRRGDRVFGTVWHEDLDTAVAGDAHVAILLGDVVVWETTIAIPAPADVHPFDVMLPRGVEGAERLGFHIHNHGFNSWRLASVEWEGG